ncbi:MAG: Crp/Fnr family transcriptional regulator [Chitinophagaceae bacterium]
MNTALINTRSSELSLKRNSINETITGEHILNLQDFGVTRHITQNKIIQVSDASIRYVYLLKKGLVKISNISETNEEVIKYFIKPGVIFGELNILGNEEKRHEIAVALQDSEVCFIPAETVVQLMETNKSVNTYIRGVIGERFRKMEDRMFSLMLKDVKDRILDFLKEFVKEFGEPVNGGYMARNFLTHEDIARITATSRQSVTGSLVNLKKLGFIDYNNKSVSVFHFPKA